MVRRSVLRKAPRHHPSIKRVRTAVKGETFQGEQSMQRSPVALLVFLPLVLAVEVQGTERNAPEEPSSAPKRYGISVEGDAWHTMWEGLGHGSLNYTDYDIGSTMIYGVTISGFYRTRSSTWFGLGFGVAVDGGDHLEDNL